MKIIPRRPYRDEEPDGYLESDREFVLNNLGVALAMLEPKWSEEWPTEPGYYWFYGWRNIAYKEGNWKPTLRMVYCNGTKFNHSTKGQMDGQEIGLWTPAFPPEAPDLSESNLGLEKEK